MNRHLQTLVILGALVGTSCADDAPTVRDQPLEAAGPVVETPRVDPAVERADKKAAAQIQPRGPIDEPVDWASVTSAPAVSPDSFPDEERAKLSQIRVPVLVPPDPALLETVLVTHNGDWYTARMKGDGITVYIRGTRKAFDVPGMEEIHLPDTVLSRTHGIVTVTFRRYGVAYNLDVECLGALDDPRCTEDDYATELVETLAVAGGAP